MIGHGGVLRVMTLNALFRAATEQRWREIAAWIEREDPDIVCLQECRRAGGGDIARWLTGALPARWHDAFGGSPEPAASAGLCGNAIASSEIRIRARWFNESLPSSSILRPGRSAPPGHGDVIADPA